jgi:hypothetical protein
MGPDALSRWLARYLVWIVWVLLALWTPPAAFTIAVNAGVITDAGSGFPGLTDIPFALTLLQLVLMAGSLPGLLRHRTSGWRLQAAAATAWAASVAWLMQSAVRLNGIRALAATDMLLAVAMVAIYWLVLLSVRRHFDAPRAVALDRIVQVP